MSEINYDKPNSQAEPRLKFIDLARALAILLMLEGHFVGEALGERGQYAEHPVYKAWNFVRGFTAPLFFTVAGMIFTYLLGGETEPRFLKRKRVRKGLRRAGELLLWGYALQLSASRIQSYAQLDFTAWASAFHVLQCIGIGLVALLVIAAIRHRIGGLALAWWYLGACVATLAVYIWLRQMPQTQYVPAGWPQIIQNPIRGPHSVFPLAPWLAFVFLGGAIGDCVRIFRGKLQTPLSCLWFFALAAVLEVLRAAVFSFPDLDDATVFGLTWFTSRAAQVVAFIGLLRWVETMWGIGLPRLLVVGRLTFEIYIIHGIILYGSLTGIGLSDWISGKLGPWQATLGAAIFILFFLILAQFIDSWKSRKRA